MTPQEMNEEHQSAISALVDGELEIEALEGVLGGFSEGMGSRNSWACYHLIGEALRSGDQVMPLPRADFVARTMSRIALLEVGEAGVMAGPDLVSGLPQSDAFPAAANDPFKWKLVAGLASLAAVAAVGWAGLGFGGFGQGAPAVLASVSGAPALLASAGSGVDGGTASELTSADAVAASEQPMLRNAELDRYLTAHSQAVGGAALQTTGNFVHNASFTSTNDGQ